MSQSVQEVFPFCPVVDAAVGDGTLHPFPATALQARTLYRGVKLWSLEVVTSWGTYTFPDLQFGNAPTVALTEHDLACMPQQGGFSRWRIFGEFNGVPPPEISIRWEMFLFSELVDPGVPGPSGSGSGSTTTDSMFISGSYYPQLYFGLTAFNDAVTAAAEDVSTFNDFVATPTPTTLTINGIPVQLYSFGVGNILSIALSPQEYWEYAPTSGGLPVHDSATGAQINPNVVID